MKKNKKIIWYILITVIFTSGFLHTAHADSTGNFVASSSGNFTVPAGVTKITVSIAGGGGGGGGGAYTYGGGGGGAGDKISTIGYYVTPGQVIPFTIGNGGFGGGAGSFWNPSGNGEDGELSTFGIFLSAAGGKGGKGGIVGGGGGQGGLSGGIGGSNGTNGDSFDGQRSHGGNGGNTPFGIGGVGGYGNSSSYILPTIGTHGGGGGGASGWAGINDSGAQGAKGYIQITYYSDMTSPVITLLGSNPTSISLNTTFIDAGATAFDAIDGSVGVVSTSTVNTAIPGSYTITYTATDAAGNSAIATRTVNVIATIPIIVWNKPVSVTYGTALSATQLNATTSVPGTLVYSPTLGTILNAGTTTLNVTFIPSVAGYSVATSSVQIFVSKINPTVTWNNPIAISYGTGLSATQLNATTSVPGTFTYSPVLGTILPAGTSTLSVTFTPTSGNYNSVTKTVQIFVSKVNSILTWNNPAPIVYGTALSGTQLHATASVAGTFSYTPVSGTVLNIGTTTLSVTFTPTSANYIVATKTVQIFVSKVTPIITWNTPTNIIFGTALSATQMNATSNTPGTFSYTPSLGTVLPVGISVLTANFTPTSANYNSASAAVQITVVNATSSIVWNNPASIVFGTALSGTQLNATSTVPGTFSYSPVLGTVLNAGTTTLSVIFTPASNNFSSSTKSVTIFVAKANPVITWNNPVSISQGTALTSTQLNATSTVPGTFAYNPSLGTILGAGTSTLNTTLTPNSTNYNSATKTVQIFVIATSTPTSTDTIAPSIPSILFSSAATGTITASTSITLKWSQSTDNAGGSGIAGYVFSFDANPTATLGNTISTTATGTTQTLAYGKYYFHLKAKDNAGNSSSVMNFGPIILSNSKVLILNSSLGGTFYDIYSPTLSIANTLKITGITTIKNSLLTAPWDISSSTLTGVNLSSSTIARSNLSNCTILNSTVLDVTASGCSIVDAYVDPSTILNSAVDASSTVTDSYIASSSNIVNSNIDVSTTTASDVTNSNVSGSTIDDSEITDTTVATSSISSSTIATSTIDNSIVENSAIADSAISSSTIASSSASTSTITSSDISDSDISDSNIAHATSTDSSLSDSEISDSEISNSTTTDASIDRSFVSTSTISDSSIINSDISSSTISNSTNVSTSTIDNSDIDFSVVNDSDVGTSTISDSVVASSSVENSTVDNNSSVVNTDISSSTVSNSLVQNSDIDDSEISSSTLNHADVGTSTVGSSTISSSTISNSDIGNSELTNTTIENSTTTNIVSSTSTIEDSVLSTSTTKDSDIATSTISDSFVIDSEISSSSVDQSLISSSTIDISLIDSSSITDSEISSSTIASSTIASSTVSDSDLLNTDVSSSTLDEVITHGTSTTIINSDISSTTITNGNISDGNINSGTIVSATGTSVVISTSTPLVNLINYSPTAFFSATTSGLIVYISDKSSDPNSGTPLDDSYTYSWDFGDGTQISNSTAVIGNSPTHTYSTAGTFTISLMLSDLFNKFSNFALSIVTHNPAPTSGGGGGSYGGGSGGGNGFTYYDGSGNTTFNYENIVGNYLPENPVIAANIESRDVQDISTAFNTNNIAEKENLNVVVKYNTEVAEDYSIEEPTSTPASNNFFATVYDTISHIPKIMTLIIVIVLILILGSFFA